MKKLDPRIIVFLATWLAVETGAWGIQLAIVKVIFVVFLSWLVWKLWIWGNK